MSVLPIATEGLRRSEEKVQRAAERLARLPLSPGDAPEDLVDLSAETVALMQAQNAQAANATVVHTTEEMERRILDILG